MRKILLICIFFACIAGNMQSQVVTGKVLEKGTGETLIGVSVALQNATQRTVTDINGAYSIAAGEGDVLSFSYLGMTPQRITVGKTNVIDVFMSPDQQQLDEIVVVGYGTMRRKDLTGSISSLKGEDLEKTTSSSVLEGLAGKLPGVQVIQNSGTPGGDVTVRVRGIGTINNSDPLYVVDGVPANGGIWYLNPNDIQSIDVLKDASATAIYGARGANGVIMVTTKRGVKGKKEIAVDYSYGIQNITKLYDMMDASQYAALHNEMRTNAGGAAAGYDLNPLFANPQSLGAGTDWQDQIFRTAYMQKVGLSISGGDKVVHSTSLGYYKQDGVMKNTGYNRVTLQSNIRSELHEKFRLTSNIALSGQESETRGTYTVIANAMRILPHIPVRDELSNLTGPIGRADLNGQAINPVGIIETQTNTTPAFRGVANVSGELDITDYLQFKTTGGTETGFDFNNAYYPKFQWGNYQQDETSQSNSASYEVLMTWDNMLTFNKKTGNHSITALAGTSFQNYTKKWVGASGVGRASDMTVELDNALEAKAVSGNRSDWATMSYLGRVNYAYDNRYSFTASLRADGSSRFGPDNRFGYFPSFAGAWTASNEDFMKDISQISFLKLRLGYGKTGNQLISGYIYADKLEVNGQYNFGSSRGFASVPAGIIYPNKLPNPAVKWESAEQYNVGFDVSVLDSRISLTADFYLKNTNDMLTRVPVPQTSGYSLNSGDWPYMNIGQVRNTGVELTLSTVNFDTKDFRWSSDFNIAFNKNEVIDVGGIDIYGTNAIIEGQPINVFYGYVVDHIYQNVDDVFTGPAMESRAADRASYNPYLNTAPGDIAFKKLTEGDVITEEDRTVIGSPHPKFTAGLNNTLTYKNIDLSFFLQGVYGNKIFNHVRLEHEGMSTTYNQFASTKDRWTGEGTSTTMPRAIYADPNNNIRVSDRFIEDGSFLKIRNVTLGYNLPKQWTNFMSIKVYANIDNLLTFTKYSGLDPEVGLNGYDNFIYPPARTILFGLNVKF